MKRKRRRPNRYYVEPFSIGRNAWPLTAKEIIRMIRYVGIACWVTLVLVLEMFAYLHPDSVAAIVVPFFVFVLLLLPTLHVIHRLLRPSDTEIGYRWDYILSHPQEYPGAASANIAD
jgi:hypothetical protein